MLHHVTPRQLQANDRAEEALRCSLRNSATVLDITKSSLLGAGRKACEARKEKPAMPTTRTLSEYQCWGLFPSLGAPVRPPLPSIARLTSARETILEKQGMKNDAEMLISEVGASAPASGCVGFSSTRRGCDAGYSSAPALRTLPPSKSPQAPPRSHSSKAVATRQDGIGKRMHERATAARAANIGPIRDFDGPHPPSLISTPCARVGDSSPIEWNTPLGGKED